MSKLKQMPAPKREAQKREAQKREAQKGASGARKINPAPVLHGAIAAVVGIALVVLFSGIGMLGTPTAGVVMPSLSTAPDSVAIAGKTIGYVEANFLAPQGLSAELVGIEEQDPYLYAVSFNVMEDGSAIQQATVYVTRDGKQMLLGNLFDMDEALDVPDPQPGDTGTPQEFTKSDRPNVKMFVMSFCPYGQQAEAGLLPVYGLLGDTIEFEPRYVIYGPESYAGQEDKYCLEGYCSMHGISELMEDVRQMCVWKYERDKWVDYINGINDACNYQDVETCWTGVAAGLGIDVGSIKSCATAEAVEMLAAEYALNQEYSVRGSPMVLINGTPYSGQRTPEAYKDAICGAFNSPPDECAIELSSAGTAASGGCG